MDFIPLSRRCGATVFLFFESMERVQRISGTRASFLSSCAELYRPRLDLIVRSVSSCQVWKGSSGPVIMYAVAARPTITDGFFSYPHIHSRAPAPHVQFFPEYPDLEPGGGARPAWPPRPTITAGPLKMRCGHSGTGRAELVATCAELSFRWAQVTHARALIGNRCVSESLHRGGDKS